MRDESTCTQIQRTWQRMLAAAVLGLSTLPALAASQVTPGHAGHWWSPERSGEGFVLEMIGDDAALLYWFTYDEDGSQRWMTAEGRVADGEGDDDGQHLEFAQLVAAHGPRFGDDFDPADVVREVVGSARLQFDDCDNGTFSYEAFGQAQAIDVQRLAHVMGASCESPHGVAGREVAAHAGLSGSWFDPAHNGEGFALHWGAPDQAIVTWYSYDDEGNPYWMLGVGGFDTEGHIHFADLHTTRGARFGDAFDPDDVERIHWGELSFDLGCDAGTASYDSALPAFGQGSFELSRITAIDGVPCPWTPPALSDLYTIELVELPTQVEDWTVPATITRPRLSGGGVIWATAYEGENPYPVYLSPGADAWQQAGDSVMAGELFAARRSTAAVTSEPGIDVPTHLVRWQDGKWQRLPDEAEGSTMGTGISADGAVALGTLYEDGESSHAFRWTEAAGLELLPRGEGMTGIATPIASSDDGATVVGVMRTPPRGPQRAVIWRGDEPAGYLRTGDGFRLGSPVACADDCRIVFGNTYEWPGSPPIIRTEPWYWRADGGVGFLPPPVGPDTHRHFVVDASGDGSMVIGIYGSFAEFSGAQAGTAKAADEDGIDTLVWTTHTGIGSIRSLLAAGGHELDGWGDIRAESISADGRLIALTVQRPAPGFETFPVLVRLEPVQR